jgi:hypothetical protein
LVAGIAATVLFACSEAPEEPAPENIPPREEVVEPVAKSELLVAEQRAPSPREFYGNIKAVGNSTWSVSSNTAQLTCQRAVMNNPFRAQWFDSGSRIGLVASGFPLNDGSDETRVESFRLTSLVGSKITNAEVTDAALSFRVVSSERGSSVFEVSAKGKIAGGGSFEASGKCRG